MSAASAFVLPVDLWGTPFALSTIPQAGHRTDSGGLSGFGDRRPLLVVAAEAPWPKKVRMGSIVVLANLDSRLDEVRAQRARWDLQLQPGNDTQLSLPA